MIRFRQLLLTAALVGTLMLWTIGLYAQLDNPPMIALYIAVSVLLVAVARG